MSLWVTNQDNRSFNILPNLVFVGGFTEASVRSLIDADPFAKELGVDLVGVTSDEIVLSLEVTDRLTNFLGLGHGGVVFSLADIGMSYASNVQEGTSLAIDAHLALMAPSRSGDQLVARITEVSRGRTLGTYRAEVTRSDGRSVGSFTGTVHISSG